MLQGRQGQARRVGSHEQRQQWGFEQPMRGIRRTQGMPMLQRRSGSRGTEDTASERQPSVPKAASGKVSKRRTAGPRKRRRTLKLGCRGEIAGHGAPVVGDVSARAEEVVRAVGHAAVAAAWPVAASAVRHRAAPVAVLYENRATRSVEQRAPLREVAAGEERAWVISERAKQASTDVCRQQTEGAARTETGRSRRA